ncbi:hypothetical protein JQ614_02495 [Bradyrhizobium diazoefficiens]|nr:hypothetical protein [Bradyrhizobium diazoefficiens]MBR0917061.1 hypothetical protein [Bradyrhizobium diazoefficiens]
MTELVTSVQTDIIESAFAAVNIRDTVAPHKGGKLYKDVSSSVVVAATEAWQRIRELLEQASRKGWDTVQTMVDDVNNHIDALAKELREEAEDFKKFLLEKLQELMRETFDVVLRSIRSQVQIGDATYVLTSIQLESKLVYSSSIEASVTALCKFVGKGEAVVTGTYMQPTSGASTPSDG